MVLFKGARCKSDGVLYLRRGVSQCPHPSTLVQNTSVHHRHKKVLPNLVGGTMKCLRTPRPVFVLPDEKLNECEGNIVACWMEF